MGVLLIGLVHLRDILVSIANTPTFAKCVFSADVLSQYGTPAEGSNEIGQLQVPHDGIAEHLMTFEARSCIK